MIEITVKPYDEMTEEIEVFFSCAEYDLEYLAYLAKDYQLINFTLHDYWDDPKNPDSVGSVLIREYDVRERRHTGPLPFYYGCPFIIPPTIQLTDQGISIFVHPTHEDPFDDLDHTSPARELSSRDLTSVAKTFKDLISQTGTLEERRAQGCLEPREYDYDPEERLAYRF